METFNNKDCALDVISLIYPHEFFRLSEFSEPKKEIPLTLRFLPYIH